MPNRGLVPLDITTPVGQLRALVGDTSFVALDPDEPGYGDYAVFADTTLAAALEAGSGSLYRGAGNLYSQLAIEYIQLGKSIRAEDLSIDTRGRGKDFLEVAKAFWAEAATADESAAGDIFSVVGQPPRVPCDVRPEGTPWPLI